MQTIVNRTQVNKCDILLGITKVDYKNRPITLRHATLRFVDFQLISIYMIVSALVDGYYTAFL